MTTVEFEGATYDLKDFQHPGGSVIRGAYLKDATMIVHAYHSDVERIRKAIAPFKMEVKNGTKAKESLYKGPLYEDLKKRVQTALKNNHQSRGADALLRCKMIALVLGFIGAFAWLTLSENSTHIRIAAIALGTVGALVGMNVNHDASHMAVECGPKVGLNYIWQLSGDMIGLSTLGWRYQHAIQHHIHTDNDEDPDAAFMYPLLRTSESQPHLLFHYVQVLAFPVVAFGLICLFQAYDTIHTLTGIYTYEGVKKPDGTTHTPQEWAQFALCKVCLCLQWGMIFYKGGLEAWLMYCAVGSFILSSIDVPGHYTTHPPLPRMSKLPPSIQKGDVIDSWLLHQLHTTNSFEPNTSWLYGGLNMQIEHHLFPKISHRHYPYLIRPILHEFCKEHNLPYNDYSLLGVVKATVERMLILSVPPKGKTL